MYKDFGSFQRSRKLLTQSCTNGITSSNNNIKPLLNQEVLINPPLNAISTREKESTVRQDVNINLENSITTE